MRSLHEGILSAKRLEDERQGVPVRHQDARAHHRKGRVSVTVMLVLVTDEDVYITDKDAPVLKQEREISNHLTCPDMIILVFIRLLWGYI